MMHTLATVSHEFRSVLTTAKAWLAMHGKALAAAILLLVLLVWVVVHPHDHFWLQSLREGASKKSPLMHFARQVSYWGDFLGLNVLSFAAMLVIARWRQKPEWVRMAAATLMGACMTGLLAVIIRPLLGRARPSATVADDFYGWGWTSALQSCPSGHTATAFGLAIPLLIAEPRLGAPAMLMAGGVAWSRMYMNQHYPADVLTSLCLSLMIGIPLGMAVRRRNRLALGRVES